MFMQIQNVEIKLARHITRQRRGCLWCDINEMLSMTGHEYLHFVSYRL